MILHLGDRVKVAVAGLSGVIEAINARVTLQSFSIDVAAQTLVQPPKAEAVLSGTAVRVTSALKLPLQPSPLIDSLLQEIPAIGLLWTEPLPVPERATVRVKSVAHLALRVIVLVIVVLKENADVNATSEYHPAKVKPVLVGADGSIAVLL